MQQQPKRDTRVPQPQSLPLMSPYALDEVQSLVILICKRTRCPEFLAECRKCGNHRIHVHVYIYLFKYLFMLPTTTSCFWHARRHNFIACLALRVMHKMNGLGAYTTLLRRACNDPLNLCIRVTRITSSQDLLVHHFAAAFERGKRPYRTL